MVSARRRWALCLLALGGAVPGGLAQAEESPPRILVLSLGGTADETLRAQGTNDLIGALRGFERFDVVSLADPAQILGERLATQLASCADDPCRAKALAGLGASALVAGRLDELAGSLRLDVRRVETTTAAAVQRARATLEFARGAPGVLTARMFQVATDLFAEEAERAFGTLVIEAEPEGTRVLLDGAEVGRTPLSPLRVRVGAHQLRFEHPGHKSEVRAVELRVGETHVAQAELSRVRGPLPWILGGTALGAAALGVVLGLSANGTADDWAEACGGGGACPSGYTRLRYLSDDSAVGTQQTVANVLFGTAVALSVGAVLGYIFESGEEGE